MKRILFISALLSILFSSCDKDGPDDLSISPVDNSCKENYSEELATINVFDFTPGSIFYNRAISVFKITKERISRSGNCLNKPLSECKNKLQIQNTTSKNISYSFVIEYRLNAYYWTYQNTVTINAYSSVDLGTINNNCGLLNQATILVKLGTITYQ